MKLMPDVMLIGCGNMGRSIASRYHAQRPAARLLIVDPNVDRVRAALPNDGRIAFAAALNLLAGYRPDMTVLAVKPEAMAAPLQQLAPHPAAGGLVVSVAAGITAATLRIVLGDARIVRAMPNTPALVGEGITGLWAMPEVTRQDKLFCESVFGAVGRSIWVREEAEIAAVTSVSGSGPAYMFAFVEALAQAGTVAGLDSATAEDLARATMIGAAAMLRDPASELATLKAAVRSPGGTTDAALRVFEDGDRLAVLVGDAVKDAHRRALALGGPAAGMPGHRPERHADK